MLTNCLSPKCGRNEHGGIALGRIEKTVSIEAPVDRVWTLLEDVEKYPSYFTFIKSVEVIYHPKGECLCNIEGVKGRAVFEVAGRKMELEVVDELYIPHEKTVRKSTSGMPFESILSTEATDRGTILQWFVSYDLPYGILGSIMDRVMFSKEMEKHMERSLDNVKKALEQKEVK